MKKFCIAILAFIMVFSFSACKSSDDGSSDDAIEGQIEEAVDTMDSEEEEDMAEMPEGEAVVYPEEEDGAKIQKVEADSAQFIGTWEGKSFNAVQLYGNLKIKVKANGTWTANITGDELKGTWKNEGDHLHMTSDAFEFDLAFDRQGNLVMIEGEGEDELHTVLEKQ